MKYIRTVLAVLVLVLFDQWTKYMAVGHLMGTDGVTLIPGVFKLYYLENSGSAFGMLQNQKTFFIIFTIIALILITWIFIHIPDKRRMLPLQVIALLIFAGAVGNFIDRIRQSYVVDFFYFELIDFPIFNVADIYVTVSAFLLIFLVIFYYKDDDFEFLKLERR
jgi:signal peptidase II